MLHDTQAGRRKPSRRLVPVVLALLATLLAPVAISLTSSASADTSGSPDTNTKAAFAPTAANLNPGATLAGAVQGSAVNIHVDGVGGKFFGVNAARLCRSGLNISTSSQMSPTSFGNCIAQPFVASGPTADNDFVSASAAPTNTSVDFVFKVGTGTESAHPGPGSAITCDVTTPCSIWLWESVDTTIAASGNIFKHFDVTYAGTPGAPTVSVTPGNQQLTVNLTAPANTGNAPITQYSVTVTGPGGATQSGSGLVYTFTGLTNFTSYPVTATAQNTAADGTTHFTSANGTGSGTPVPPSAGKPSGTPGNQKVDLTWPAPASGPTPSTYDIEATDTSPGAPPATVVNTGSSATAFSVTGLTNGHPYTFRVRAVYSGTPGSYGAASDPIVPNNLNITDTITVRRPQGALVLTQVCANNAPQIPGGVSGPVSGPVTDKQYDYAHLPQGSPLALGTASTNVDPFYTPTVANPNYGYPYPSDNNGEPVANYPTDCNVNLGTAHLVTSGAGAGQYFLATGALNQVTVVDTRDTDGGWTVNGSVNGFAIPGVTGTNTSFSGNQLGWAPHLTSQTAGFTDGGGTPYAMSVTEGGPVAFSAPISSPTPGLATSKVLGSATATHGLGIAQLDAPIKLWIPVFAHTGNYVGTLTITAIGS